MRDAEAEQCQSPRGPRAGDAEAALGEGAAFGQQVEFGTTRRLARDEIDDAGVGVRSVDGGLRPANHLDVVERFGRNVREIEGAAERIDGDAIDLDQVEVGISAAQEEAGTPPAEPVWLKATPGM